MEDHTSEKGKGETSSTPNADDTKVGLSAPPAREPITKGGGPLATPPPPRPNADDTKVGLNAPAQRDPGTKGGSALDAKAPRGPAVKPGLSTPGE
jgi:hypothetical protein